jgi:hypothetical protein
VVVALVVDLLGLGQQRLDPLAKLDQRVALVGLLDDAGDQLADPVLVLLEHHHPFGLADPLQDHLLGGLRGDPAEVVGGDIAGLDLVLVGRDHLRVELGLLELFQLARLGVDLALFFLLRLGCLGEQLLLQLDRQDQLEDAEVAGFVVEVDAGVFGRPWGLLVGGEQRVGERIHQFVGGDALLLLERLDCLDDLLAHGCSSVGSKVGWVRRYFGPGEETSSEYSARSSPRCLVTRSQSARSTPAGWSMKRRSDSVAGCSSATRSSSASSSLSCCWMLSLRSAMPGLGRKKSGPGPLLATA